MLKRFAVLVGCAVAALSSFASSASAQGINIDIEWPAGAVGGPGVGVPDATFGAAANQPGAWNRVFQILNPVALNDLTGAASGVQMLRSTTNTHGGVNNANTSGNHAVLLDDYQSFAGTLNISFSGLDPGWYEVYTYAIDPASSALRTRVTVNGSVSLNPQQVGGIMPVNGFILGRTHSRHHVQVTQSGTLSVSMVGTVQNGAFCGMQIKPVGPPAVVDIISPCQLCCVCDEAPIRATVSISAPGTVAYWLLEYKALNDPNYALLDFGFTTFTNTVIHNWDTTGLTEGYYFLRLTAVTGDGFEYDDVHVVWVDQTFQALSLNYPVTGQAYGGSICIGGIVHDTCLRNYTIQWAPLPAGVPFTDVNPGTPNYFADFPIVGTWTSWDTVGQSIPDGDYRIKVDALDTCGHGATKTADIIVDNTLPDAVITSPTNCEYVGCGLVTVKGTACDTNLAGWVVQVIGGPYNNWVTINAGNTCVNNDVLAVWDTTNLPLCAYSIRLVVSDSSILNCNGAIVNQSEFLVSVNVGLKGDVNGDGVVSFPDIIAVLAAWGQVCP